MRKLYDMTCRLLYLCDIKARCFFVSLTTSTLNSFTQLLYVLGHVMYALIDCNSFYATCEKLFRPDLKNKPVVVLSNNDGCIVARSKEAKELGIKMGVPYFQVKDFCKQNNVEVFSSNYALYADMSQRVMSTLEALCPTVEVYSIDEAFLYLADYPAAMQNLDAYGRKLKATVEQYTGISVGVGIGKTKTLAKLANHAAKKYPATRGVCVLVNERWIRRLMQITDVGEVWGIGRRYKQRLNALGVETVQQLAICEPGKIRQHFGVVLERTCLELNGQSCIGVEIIEPKQQIISSRSFSKRITNKQELTEAVCGHAAQAASKLRLQNSVCSFMTVFAKNSAFNKQEKYTPISGQYQFHTPTADTRVMVAAAREVMSRIYKENVRYAKAGVMLSGICQHDEVQLDLFELEATSEDSADKKKALMAVMDELNNKYKADRHQQNALFIASEGIKEQQTWQMSRELLSPCYTTRVSDLLVVK